MIKNNIYTVNPVMARALSNRSTQVSAATPVSNMSVTEKAVLSSVQANVTPNQYAYSNVNANGTILSANTETDVLYITTESPISTEVANDVLLFKIVEDPNHLFVTQAKITEWDNKAGKNHTHKGEDIVSGLIAPEVIAILPISHIEGLTVKLSEVDAAIENRYTKPEIDLKVLALQASINQLASDMLTQSNSYSKAYIDETFATKASVTLVSNALSNHIATGMHITQAERTLLSYFSIVDGKIKVSVDFYSLGEISAYGSGATGGGASGSLGELVNVGIWADEIPTSDRIMVQLAGATHWSSKLLSEVVGLDTIALGAYLTTNKYATETYVNDQIAFKTHTHENKPVLDLITQNHLDILSHLSLVDGKVKVDVDFWSTGEISAYGAGTGTGGASGSLGGLTNVGTWADSIPTSDRIMVQLSGATHWSSKLLSEVTGLDTTALGSYLTTNGYVRQSYVDTRVAELVNAAPSTLDTLNELAVALGNDPNFATSITNLIGTKWTQDNTKIANWDSAYNALHSHANKTELDGITSTLITNWNLAFTNNHTHPNKTIIDSLTQANLDVLAKLSIVDGNLKVDTNLWSTGEVSAYGAGSGTGGGGGLISSVFGSAGLGGSYLDSDYTNTFNAYTINLINTNLTSALGRIGTLETNTPNVVWGVATGQYSPLTINTVTRNLSLDGHTHSQYLTSYTNNYLTGVSGSGNGTMTFTRNGLTDLTFSSTHTHSQYLTAITKTMVENVLTGNITSHTHSQYLLSSAYTAADVLSKLLTVDGSGSGLDADLLRGVAPSSLAVLSATKLANTRTIWGQNFNGEENVSGAITGATAGAFSSYVAAQRFYTGYDSGQANSFSCSNWFRSNGATGWLNATYTAGILSDTANIVRTYSTNKFKVYNTEADSIYTLGGIKADGNSTLRGITLSNGANTRNMTVGSNGGIQIAGVIDSFTYSLPATIGWYRVAVSPVGVERPFGQFDISWTLSSYHGSLSLTAGMMYSSAPFISQTAYTNFGTCITKSRIVYHTTYSGTYAYLEVYNETGKNVSLTVRGYNLTGWNLYSASTVGSIPSGYSNKEISHISGYMTSGNVAALGEITAYSASDIRLKTEIVSLSNSLQIIDSLNPVSYKWNSLAKELNPMKGDEKDYGLIAQELEGILPELVHPLYSNYKAIDYIKLIPLLIKGIQELNKKIKDHGID